MGSTAKSSENYMYGKAHRGSRNLVNMLQARAMADCLQNYKGKILIPGSSIHRDYSMFNEVDTKR